MRTTVAIATLALLGGTVSPALAQTGRSDVTLRTSGKNPKRDTLVRMAREMTITFEDHRLEAVVNFIRDFTGAEIEAKWLDDRTGQGLDPEALVTLDVRNMPALDVLERVLEKTASEFDDGGNGWQLSKYGTLEVGPKSRLNESRRVEIYDINDLLFNIPTYDNAPEFDLQSVLQSSGQGGGGGRSPFQNQQDQDENDRIPKDEQAQDIIDLITSIVEPEQWVDMGGEAATIRYFRGNLIVNAPDYVHRGINGYQFWPQQLTRVTYPKGRRYVSLDMDAVNNVIDDFANQPVTGVAGGGAGGAGGGGGDGGGGGGG